MEADSTVPPITCICIKRLCHFFDIDFIIIAHMSFNSFVILPKNFIEDNSNLIFNKIAAGIHWSSSRAALTLYFTRSITNGNVSRFVFCWIKTNFLINCRLPVGISILRFIFSSIVLKTILFVIALFIHFSSSSCIHQSQLLQNQWRNGPSLNVIRQYNYLYSWEYLLYCFHSRYFLIGLIRIYVRTLYLIIDNEYVSCCDIWGCFLNTYVCITKAKACFG